MLRTDELLLRARVRISKTTYKLVNKETGCYGVAVRLTPGSRSNITIHHRIDCRCVDVHMRHLAKHAHVTYKRKGIKKPRRDDLIMAIKLRLPNVGIRVKMRRSTKPISPAEADDKPRRVIEEMPSGQILIEMWDTVEAWNKRTIWKDW
ncbi:hypothetical protein F5Y06DRAFT_305665 [Hypoxylon sp. FL0890]|nr:hypothetical protein F5Y06DRAFT_305665 [Hypoxylon sp. FL0890]